MKSGDILGIFLPRDGDSRLRLRSESSGSPTQYYLPTVSATSSPHDEIDVQDNSVQMAAYHPLVTVEFGMCVVIAVPMTIMIRNTVLSVKTPTVPTSSNTLVCTHLNDVLQYFVVESTINADIYRLIVPKHQDFPVQLAFVVSHTLHSPAFKEMDCIYGHH